MLIGELASLCRMMRDRELTDPKPQELDFVSLEAIM